MTAKHYNNKTYQANRRTLLASHPICVWCNVRKATTADHVLEVDRGGDHSLNNLVPACHTCNSKRGAQYGNAKPRKRAPSKARAQQVLEEAALKTEDPVFLVQDPDPGPPSGPNLPKVKRTRTKPPETVMTSPLVEMILPRLETPRRGENDSAADIALLWKQVMGMDLMPWQLHALAGITGADESGFPLHRISTVQVARQNGKSTAQAALILWWLTKAPILRGGPQLVISTAHTLDLAVSLFQMLAPRLEAQFDAKAKWSFGRNELTMPDGSMWLVRAATGSAGHGRSPDLVCADETWDIAADVIDQGLIPAQRARRNPLCTMWSTAGTEGSELLLRYREQGLRAISSKEPGPLYMAEWSVPADADPSDSELWPLANPAIGHTLDLSVLEAEFKSPNRSAFLRASLNMWVAADRAWLEHGVWDNAQTDRPVKTPPTVLAIDTSTDGTRYAGVAAHLEDGIVHVRTAFTVSSAAQMWTETEDIMRQAPACLLAITPGLQIHTPPNLLRRSTTVGQIEVGKWTALVKAMLVEGRLVHGDDLALKEQMARAVSVNISTGPTLSSQKSPGPIELARLVVFAASLASKPRNRARPEMGLARR